MLARIVLLSPVGGAPSPPAEEISDSASNMWEGFLDALPRLGVAVVVVAIGWILARGVRYAMLRTLRRNRTPSFARVMSKLTGWLILAVAVLAAIAATFPSVKPVDLLAGLGFFSVAVGFAFQDILENTLAGVLLLFRQPFRSGDQIEVQEHTGTVESITIRETRIKTFDGQLVLIPNRDVYKSVIRVQTHYDRRRLEFIVGIAYENDTTLACDTIEAALRSVDGVIPEPPPEALVGELGASTVDIHARFWAGPRQREGLAVLHRAIQDVKQHLEAAGVEMPADIVVLQAAPSFKAALHGDEGVTPGGGLARARPPGS